MRKPFARSLSHAFTHAIPRACAAAGAGHRRAVRVRHRRHLRRPDRRRPRPRQLRGARAGPPGSWFQYGGEQAPYTPHSGDRRATLGFDGGSATSAIGFLTPSTFQGAWFAGFDGVNVAMDLYFGGSLVASTSLLDLSDSPTFLGGGFAGLVDRLRVPQQRSGLLRHGRPDLRRRAGTRLGRARASAASPSPRVVIRRRKTSGHADVNANVNPQRHRHRLRSPP